MSSPQITLLLARVRVGSREALDELLPLVYRELRNLARHKLSGDRGQTLTTTALVHEAYLKLFGYGEVALEDRRHFFALAAKAMRQIVIDHARRRKAQKRGGDWIPVDLDPGSLGGENRFADVLAIDEALARLECLSERLAQVVELRFFAGLSVEETAGALGVTDRTIKRDWRKARAFLFDALQDPA